MEVLLCVFWQGRPKFRVAGVFGWQGFALPQSISLWYNVLYQKLVLFSYPFLTLAYNQNSCKNLNLQIGLLSHFGHTRELLKGEQRPAAFAIACFCFCECRTVSYSGSCGKQVADVVQSMLVFVFPLMHGAVLMFLRKILYGDCDSSFDQLLARAGTRGEGVLPLWPNRGVQSV